MTQATPSPRAPTDVWADRSDPDWAAQYWAAVTQPHRHALVRAIDTLAPFDSVLELGCAAGVNLRLLHDRYHHVRLSGIDVNATLVDLARVKSAEAGWALHATQGDIRTVDPLPAADVVFSCYTLAYLTPDDARQVVRRMSRAAQLGIVVMEPMSEHRFPVDVWNGEPAREIAHPYTQYLWNVDHGDTWRLTHIEAVPRVDRLNRCLVFRRRPSRPT